MQAEKAAASGVTWYFLHSQAFASLWCNEGDNFICAIDNVFRCVWTHMRRIDDDVVAVVSWNDTFSQRFIPSSRDHSAALSSVKSTLEQKIFSIWIIIRSLKMFSWSHRTQPTWISQLAHRHELRLQNRSIEILGQSVVKLSNAQDQTQAHTTKQTQISNANADKFNYFSWFIWLFSFCCSSSICTRFQGK